MATWLSDGVIRKLENFGRHWQKLSKFKRDDDEWRDRENVAWESIIENKLCLGYLNKYWFWWNPLILSEEYHKLESND